MSSEYTIDIQLTELGFPDILQPSDTPVKEAPCALATSYASFATPRSTTSTGGQLIGGRRSVVENPPAAAVTQDLDMQITTGSGLTTPTKTLLCAPPHATQSQQDQQVARVDAVDAAEGNARPQVAVRSTSRVGTTETPVPTTQQKIGEAETENGQKDVDGQDAKGNSTKKNLGEESESDDSDVSEEEEEEEDEEEEVDIESSHSGDYRCSVCDLQLRSNIKLQEHMNLHTGARPYCCAECGKRFCQINNYRAHLRTHAQSKMGPLSCRVCLKVFTSKEGLKHHLSTTHFEKEFYECDLCKRVFTDLKACEWHMEWHKNTMGKGNFVCETCGRIFSHQKSLTRHQFKKCHRSYSCTDCTKSFSNKNALLKHSFSHLGLLPYTCIRCRCHFRLAKLYRQHKCEPERIHCVACLRVFLSQEDFQKHKKDTGCWGHQEPKGDEIRCLECGQRFDTVDELKKHAGAHKRVLCCVECGKGFRSALLLMSHMGGHAGQTPCLCQSCGMGFPHQQGYDSHLKHCGHTPPPVSALKKRPASKRSPPPVKPTPQQDPARTVTTPAAQVQDSGSPGGVTGGVSSGSNSAQGIWQLTLDQQPPAGVNLVLFVPVSSSLASGLTFPPTIPQVPDIQVQHHVAVPPAPSHEPRLHEASSGLGMSSVLGAQLHLNAPLDLVMGNKHGAGCVAPLDLSKKSTSPKSALTICPPLPLKSEPEDPEFSEVAGRTESEALQTVENNETVLKTKTEQGLKRWEFTAEYDRHTAVKRLKTDSMDLSSVNVSATSSGLVTDIETEALSLVPDFHLI